MIAIDFSPGMHGHFLEYVVNRYLLQVNVNIENIFQSSGAAHSINTDQQYVHARIAKGGHFSSFNHLYPEDADKIIFIQHNPELDFVLLSNIFYRCHPTAVTGKDVNIKEIQQLHIDNMFDQSYTELELRKNWFTKLLENHLIDYTKIKYNSPPPTYMFDYTAFFKLNQFIIELQKLSNFLSVTLEFDQSLIELHNTFIELNQGWNQYQHCQKIIQAILNNADYPIPPNWQIQAYINCQLSNMFKLYDGCLFEHEIYPDNAQDIHRIILKHIEDFETRF
jgi:hypothetical protein